MAGSDEEWGCNDGTKSIAPGACHVMFFTFIPSVLFLRNRRRLNVNAAQEQVTKVLI